MNLRSKLSCTAGCLLLAFVNAAAPASASTMSGTLSTDDQVVQFTWNLSQASNVVAYTDSYASAGFVPVLSLFDGTTGAFITSNGGDASCSHGRMMDAGTGICNDAYLTASLAKGTYTVALSEFFNYPNGPNLSNGFSQTGTGNFTSSVCSGASGAFFETDLAPCVQRTGNYSVNLSTSATATPEPATAWLFLPVIALAAYSYRKSKNLAEAPSKS